MGCQSYSPSETWPLSVQLWDPHVQTKGEYLEISGGSIKPLSDFESNVLLKWNGFPDQIHASLRHTNFVSMALFLGLAGSWLLRMIIFVFWKVQIFCFLTKLKNCFFLASTLCSFREVWLIAISFEICTQGLECAKLTKPGPQPYSMSYNREVENRLRRKKRPFLPILNFCISL